VRRDGLPPDARFGDPLAYGLGPAGQGAGPDLQHAVGTVEGLLHGPDQQPRRRVEPRVLAAPAGVAPTVPDAPLSTGMTVLRGPGRSPDVCVAMMFASDYDGGFWPDGGHHVSRTERPTPPADRRRAARTDPTRSIAGQSRPGAPRGPRMESPGTFDFPRGS
jgi:hypothetical protein